MRVFETNERVEVALETRGRMILLDENIAIDFVALTACSLVVVSIGSAMMMI